MGKQDSGFRGSDVMYPPVPGGQNSSGSLVPSNNHYANPATPGMYAGMPPRGPEILTGAFDQRWLVNCLRRKWLSALLLGLLTTILAGLLMLWLVPLSSEVVSYIEVSNQQTDDPFEKVTRVTNPKDYEIFQQTQVVMFKSQFVLTAALNRSDVAQTNAVIKNQPDELMWLNEELKVAFPGDGQVLMVKYEGDENPEEMKTIIDAVVASYLDEVVAKKRISRDESHRSMEGMHKQLVDELRGKIEKVQTLQKELGGMDSPNATAELNMLIRDIGTINQQIAQARDELVELEVNRELQTRSTQSPTALNQAVAEELDRDPTLQGFQTDQYALTTQIRQLKAQTKRGASPQIKQLEDQLRSILQEEAQYRAQMEREVKNQLKSVPNDALQMVMTEYLLRRQFINQKITDLQTEKDQKYEEVDALGEQNGELAMLSSEVEQLQEIERQMDMKLRSWVIQDNTFAEQVKVLNKAFATPNINVYERYAIASLGGIGAFCLTCYGIALLEFRRRKLNSPTDVDEGLGIRVLGVLPSVASRSAMAPGSATAAQLSESIDNVRATLMHDSTSRPRQIVMVASPSSMEGSTTVASHLALSLTRAGRRTLLVDGDLRDPSLHKLFGLPLEDGVSELLRSEIEVSDAVRPTNTEGLWLMTAGICDMDAIHALATDQLQPIFEKLRAEFDFVIIDSAPVLGLSDSLSIGQYIDGAILTVLRDHSGIRSIHQASELLQSLGIRLIGCVVNGMPFKADRRILRLQTSIGSRAKRLTSTTASEE